MIEHIRPYRLFSALSCEGLSRVAHVRISSRRGLKMGANDSTVDLNIPDSSLLYLETMVLVAVLKLTRARRVFEFGTHLGATTVNLALNLPKEGFVYTIDLVNGARFKEWEHFPNVQHKIVSIAGRDSSTYNFGPLGLFDFVWVDGNPDRTDDTRHAFEMLDSGKLCCIGWHDYGKPEANTTAILEGLEQRIFHVEDTAVCLYFNRPMEF